MNLFQKALGYLARSIGLTDPRLVQAAGGRTTTTGELVSTASVLGLASAWACVNLLAGTIASLPLMVYRTRGGARTVATDHPLYRILHDSPNADQTAVDFWEFICASIELSGNAYAEIIRGSNGRVVALSVPIAPELMTVRRLRDGSLEYEWSDGGIRNVAPQDNMLHIRGFGGNPLGGLSTLSFGRQTFGLAQAIERASGDTFRNGVRPSGLLKTADSLTLDQRKQAEELLQEKFAGAINAGRPMLLEGGLKWQTMALTPADMDFAGTLKDAAARDIALAFGVPPMLLGLPGDSTYANYREANRALWRLTLLPLSAKLLAALCEGLATWLPDAKLTLDLDQVTALSEDRQQLWKQGSDAAFLSDEEKRAMLGLPPNLQN